MVLQPQGCHWARLLATQRPLFKQHVGTFRDLGTAWTGRSLQPLAASATGALATPTLQPGAQLPEEGSIPPKAGALHRELLWHWNVKIHPQEVMALALGASIRYRAVGGQEWEVCVCVMLASCFWLMMTL